MRPQSTSSSARQGSFTRKGRRAHVIVVHPDTAAGEQLAGLLGDELRVTLCGDLGLCSERCLSDPPDLLVVVADGTVDDLTGLLPRLDQLRGHAALVLLTETGNVAALADHTASDVVIADRRCTPAAIRGLIRQALLRQEG